MEVLDKFSHRTDDVTDVLEGRSELDFSPSILLLPWSLREATKLKHEGLKTPCKHYYL